MRVKCEGLKLSLFGQSRSGWSVVFVTNHESKRDFGAITLFFSVTPLSGRAIGEQWSYVAEILFSLIARYKSMLCRSLLGEFSTYHFL
jgi:hypothetical protein